jgi:putative salt-induced outer membrane protein YdiY
MSARREFCYTPKAMPLVLSQWNLVRAFVVAIGLCAACAAVRAQDVGPHVLPPPGAQELQLLPPIEPPESLESLMLDPATGAETIIPGETDGNLAGELLPPPMWYEPAYWLGAHPWDMGVELGVNGSEGNNNVFSMRAGGHVKRETPKWKLDASLAYNKNHSNGVETQNNGKQDLRVDRILNESPWTLFVLENLIYDEFQAWDVQLSLNTGVGRQLIKTETIDLLSRLGAGATREFGGAEEDWQPTALFGLDYNHQLSKMQKLTGKVEYYPEWEDFRQYRVVSDVGWQVDLDRPKNVSLKFSLIDRYDSTPEGASPNNVDYAVLMIWKL